MSGWMRAAALALMLSWSWPSMAQAPLALAIALYEQAAFDDALRAFDEARPGLAAAEDMTALRYRVLCLLALDRGQEAKDGVVELVSKYPAVPLDDDASPRLRALVDGARRQLLPEAIRSAYDSARVEWDAKRLGPAVDGFARVADLGRLLTNTGPLDRATTDLLVVAEGFGRLARAEIAAAESAAARAVEEAAQREAAAKLEAAAAPAPEPPAEASSTGPATVSEVFGAEDTDVLPPTAISTAILWRRGTPRPPIGTRLGDVQVVVDERGRVIEAQVVASVSAFYDPILVESALGWRYRPATRNGQPVLYRRVVTVRASG